MPSSTLRVEQSIKYGLIDESIDIASYVLVFSQRGALREGIPKRSLGTRKNHQGLLNLKDC